MRQRIPIPKEDMAYHHSIGYHSISIVYDLLLRIHAIDSRYQSEEARGRIAGTFVQPVLENAVQGVQWLSKIDPGHKIRNIWLLCILYVLQEAPEIALRKQMHDMCILKSDIKESRISRFIRILTLCTLSFQSFTDAQYLPSMSPWLVQETFNTVSAASILLVDECYEVMSQSPYEQRKMIEKTLDLLLHIISAPLSSVTLLRALGAASHVLEKVGAVVFFEAVDDNLQHWGRMIFSLMNNTSLSVRSMAVDMTVSLFGIAFNEGGNIDDVAQVFLSVLPEVVAREIALYSANGLITTAESLECSLWPLRRAIADVEEADPFDDDRVDSQLSPFLRQFCRACQAVIDGVLIELRLQGNNCRIVNREVNMLGDKSRRMETSAKALPLSWTFDADEESLFEAASFFVPETCPLQRIRWLMTLKRLHEAKGQFVEAGETLILCSKTVAEAIPHIQNVWRPSQFELWTDLNVATWLSTIGCKSPQDQSGRINRQVMAFAHEFLEPATLRSLIMSSSDHGNKTTLPRPNVPALCKILTTVAKDAVDMYDRENGMDPLTFGRLEELLKVIMGYVEEHAMTTIGIVGRRSAKVSRAQGVEEIASLRQVSATINELVTKMAERMLLLEEQGGTKGVLNNWTSHGFNAADTKTNKMFVFYVRVQLVGKKTNRFLESTTIPTFLDWNTPYICRVPSELLQKAMNGERFKYANKNMKKGQAFERFIEDEICAVFAEPYISFLQDEISESCIEFCTELPDELTIERKKSDMLFFVVTPVRNIRSSREYQSKKFQFKKIQSVENRGVSHLVEITVAKHFPCPLSRQPALLTTEVKS